MDKEDVVYVCVCVCIYIYIYIYIYIHTHTHTMEYYSAIIKNKILPPATTWIDSECIMLSEISQTEKDKCCMRSLLCRI